MGAEEQSSCRGLAGVLVGAVALVTAILLFSFQSWRQAGAVLLVVASSLAGVFLALRVGGATFNISSFVGAIMMVGIVSENAYFLVAAHRDALRRGRTRVEAARDAATRRARPVLMTTFAGVAALAPLALGVGAGSALLKPLAIAVVGGFVTSAFLLLLVLPSLLAGFGGGVSND
jgi:multidrug efflux pump subunit AcrB